LGWSQDLFVKTAGGEIQEQMDSALIRFI
jgi:hypothetical protein